MEPTAFGGGSRANPLDGPDLIEIQAVNLRDIIAVAFLFLYVAAVGIYYWGRLGWSPAESSIVALIGLATSVLFGTLVRWGIQAPTGSTRPAKIGLVCSILGVFGVVLFLVCSILGVFGVVLFFFLIIPIVLGGIGATLGLEGRHRSRSAGAGGIAMAALVVGILAFLAGIYIWLNL